MKISAPANSATVTVPGGLAATSLAFALPQTSLAGISVASAVPKVSAGTVTIKLNKAPGTGKSITVGWFIVN